MRINGVSATRRSRCSRTKKPRSANSAIAPRTPATILGCVAADSATCPTCNMARSTRECSLQIDVGLFICLEVQQLRGREVSQPGDQHVRKCLDADVVRVDRIVVDL